MSAETESSTLLLGFIRRAKAVADEIGDLQADLTAICKEAKAVGFEPSKVREVVSWLRKIDKHGRFKVDEAEAVFDLYRQVADPDARPLATLMPEERDQALLKIFAPAGEAALDEKLTKRTKTMRASLALSRAAARARTQ